MTTKELQDFAREIGATINHNHTRLTVRVGDCVVCANLCFDIWYDRSQVARLLVDKIDAVFCPSEDLLFLKERLEQVQ